MELFLNEVDYKTILKRRFKSNKVHFISADLTPLSNDVEGFMGSYFTLTLKYTVNNKTGKEQFFLKTMPQSTTFFDIAAERNVYEKEIFFYDFLLREFEALGLDITFAPTCFYCKDKQMMVMENLLDKNYKLAEKFQFWDLAQCKAGLEAVAKFNGCSLVYEAKLKVKLGAKYPEIFKENSFPIDEQSFGFALRKANIECMEIMLNKLSYDNKVEFVEGIHKIQVLKTLEDESLKKCIGHGDFWYKNIFFSENPTRCCIIDYQTLRYSPPAYDVLLFIYLNTTRAFRASNLRQLLQHYYSSLRAIVEANGYEMSGVLSEEEFRRSVAVVRSSVLFNVWATNAFILMPSDLIQGLRDELDLKQNWSELKKAKFTLAFNRDEEFRRVLTEILDDLYDSLFENNCLY